MQNFKTLSNIFLVKKQGQEKARKEKGKETDINKNSACTPRWDQK
jgi:hypothetical protein